MNPQNNNYWGVIRPDFKVPITTYTVSYNANGGSGAPAQQTKTKGQALTLSGTRPTRANASAGSYSVALNPNGGKVGTTSLSAARTTSYTFKNWNTSSNGGGTSYAPSASYTADANVTLYAQWNSSTSTASVTLPTPWRYGYTFKGWGTSSTASSGVTGSYRPSGNVTLYALWQKEDLSGWSTTKPANVYDSLIETATQYRYSDRTVNGGWTQTGSGTIDYVQSWPSGFNTSHSLYSQYNKTPKTEGTTGNKKVVVNSNTFLTYIYWHWCFNNAYTSGGNFNVFISDTPYHTDSSGRYYQYFTAFTSASDAGHVDPNGRNGGDCFYMWRNNNSDGSWWWWRIPVYRQTYTEYTGSNTSETWSDWSVWTMTRYATGADRKEQSRTVYRYTGDQEPVSITKQPTDATAVLGQSVTFKVVATGDELSCQWQYQKPGESTWNDVINNGASATYNLTTAARHNGYKYRCKVTNAVSSVYSDTVTLTLNTKPVITTQPANVTVNVGAKATFKVVATGATGYRWQYQKPGESTWNNVINNGTSATYNLTTEARHNGYKYRCKVTNAVDSAYSDTVTLTVVSLVKPTITTQPKSATVNVGAKATFKVVATGATGYKWQYQKPGESTWRDVDNNGASSTYTLITAARHNGYKYRCRVTNAAGTVTSSTATLTIGAKPTITTQPKAKTVTAGAKATFKVVAEGATSYKWQYQKPGSSTWTDVSKNGTSATYSLTTAARHNGYKYRCKVTNANGSVYTSAVKLTVK